MKRKTIFNLIFIFLLIVISLIAREFLFRYFIFSEHSHFPKLKDPGKYAKNYSDDYCKLYYKFAAVSVRQNIHILYWGGLVSSTETHSISGI